MNARAWQPARNRQAATPAPWRWYAAAARQHTQELTETMGDIVVPVSH